MATRGVCLAFIHSNREHIVSIRSIVLALVLLAATGPGISPVRAQAASDTSHTPRTADQLIQRFRVAHQKHCVPEISRLIYWGGAANGLRLSTERHIADDFPMAIARVTIEPLAAGEMLQYTKDGVTYRPTLRPIGRMKVEFLRGRDASGGVTATSYLMGVKDGAYYLLSAEPVQR